MRLFGKRERHVGSYDRDKLTPAMRCSICTGEQVAGFKNRETGRFEDRMLIRSAEDLRAFCREYGVNETDIEKIY